MWLPPPVSDLSPPPASNPCHFASLCILCGSVKSQFFCSTTIIPFFRDQFFWGYKIYQKGLGPAPIPISQLTLENLSNAIKFMLQPEVKSQAMEVAKLIKDEDGVTAAIDAFHRHLPSELPLPTPSLVEDHLNALQWFFLQISKWCSVPCGGV